MSAAEGSGMSYPDWSANVHNGFFYMLHLDNLHFAVARIAGVWWYVEGNQLNTRLDNVINFTCKEDQKSSVTISAHIHQISSDVFRVDIE